MTEALARLRASWTKRKLRAFPVTVVATLLVVLLGTARNHGYSAAVDQLSAVRLTDPLWVVMLRTPLSLFAPAYGLPMTGAVAQVLIVGAISEAYLGGRRTAVVAVATQAIVNVLGVLLVLGGYQALLGIRLNHISDRDTGPSVAVVAVGLAVAVSAGSYLLASVLCVVMVIAGIVLPDRAAHEHILGLFLGGAIGAVIQLRAVAMEHAENPHAELMRRRRMARRVAAGVVATTGAVALLSAITRPVARRLEFITELVSVGTAQAATGVVAGSGLLLLLLARSLLRGQRRAWVLSLVLLSIAAVGHLAKGVDVEEAVLAIVAAAYLLWARDSFRAHTDHLSGFHALRGLIVGATASFAGGFVVIEASTIHDHHRMRAGRAVRAVAARLEGRHVAGLAPRVDQFLRPALIGLGFTIVAVALWRSLRPVIVHSSERRENEADMARAREVIGRFGGGTLDYFALRSDKSHFFAGASLVSYAVKGGVCLVSPDPIGPELERETTWSAFRSFADEQGWIVSVLGASKEWLPIYERFGMFCLYVGDEGIVDVASFDLAGGERKSLRQAVNRIARNGYTMTFHDPATIQPQLRTQLEDLMTKSRRGGVERGFSMTLGRVFDPRDQGLLLAVCLAPDGSPAAFCQYVPSPTAGGWSLDLMRRDVAEHPNGLLDFVIVETIRHLHSRGDRTLGLNFATMRAVLAGETGHSLWQRAQRWVLQHLSADMQIASLWHFNAKYGPRWQPRYAVLDGSENAIPAAVAVARAESMWELPVIGRWFGARAVRSAGS